MSRCPYQARVGRSRPYPLSGDEQKALGTQERVTDRLHHLKELRQAIVATAHKIARVVYHLLKTGEAYCEECAEEYEQKRRARELKRLQRQAQKSGYTLAPAITPETQPDPSPGGSC
jgi:ribosomal 50S subunit-associated protein YjgA (DUF615 family)